MKKIEETQVWPWTGSKIWNFSIREMGCWFGTGLFSTRSPRQCLTMRYMCLTTLMSMWLMTQVTAWIHVRQIHCRLDVKGPLLLQLSHKKINDMPLLYICSCVNKVLSQAMYATCINEMKWLLHLMAFYESIDGHLQVWGNIDWAIA